MPNDLPRRYPEGDGLDDMSDRDLRDLGVEYDLVPAPAPQTNRDPIKGYTFPVDNDGYMVYSARNWLISKLREKHAKNPYIGTARQEAFSDDDIVTVDNQGRITVVRSGDDGATTYQ